MTRQPCRVLLSCLTFQLTSSAVITSSGEGKERSLTCHRRFNVSQRSNAGMSFHRCSPRQSRCSMSAIATRESPAPLCHGFERSSRHPVSTFRAAATAPRDQSPTQEPVALAQIWRPLPNAVRRHHAYASSAIPDKPTTSDWVRTARFRLYRPAISTSPTDCAPCPVFFGNFV
jgi:hypothetical protein